ncbi:acetyl-CoA carboxylase carboxyltransferase subunit alpha [bacterium]|nr:acetyl-CoA carboxylase carboxyltransferase subunit alpha [bacterium]
MLYYDFEKPIIELENRIEELKRYSEEVKVDASAEIEGLIKKRDALCSEVYSKLTPYEIVQIARHPQRPYTLDYVALSCEDFQELHGDRRFKDDEAMVGGFATMGGRKIMLIGQQKGRSAKENIQRNFGMAHPEGYRKAMRLMEMADRFGLPIVTLIDTAGAYPGIGAEERGQAEAIAENLRDMMDLSVPIVSVVIGEGGSGGAIGIGVCNRLLTLSYSYYSVISPEGCAAILFHDAKRAADAASALRLTARDLQKLGIADEVIEEPVGGAHRDHKAMAASLKEAVLRHIDELAKLSPQELKEQRYQKFRQVGCLQEI